MNKNCLMCSSYQKLYSALKSLENFNNNQEFCDMVSSLDTFFSELRNITFVLQKNIAHTEYNDIYSILCEQFLKNDTKMTWFVDKRNETTKENSFNLTKQVIVDVYEYGIANTILEDTYTFDNWENAKMLEQEIKSKLKNKLKVPEWYLSVKFIFKENQQEINIMDRIKYGINKFCDFLMEFENHIKNNFSCKHCNYLKGKIKEIFLLIIAEFDLNVKDFEYHSETNSLVYQGFIDILGIDKLKSIPFLDMDVRLPINNDNLLFYQSKSMIDNFKNFINLHSIMYMMQKKHLIPIFLIFYNDNTISMKHCLAQSKSTYYRKINEIAKQIDSDNIIAIFVVWESYLLPMDKKILEEKYENRVKNSEKTILCFYYIDKDLSENTVCLDADMMCDDTKELAKYIKYEMDNMSNKIIWPQYSAFRIHFAQKYHKYLNINKIS